MPDVDITFLRADSKSADNHPFQNGMGITFHQTSIHKSTGVALVAVTDNVFQIALGFAGGFPFSAGGETAAATSPQTGSFYFLDNASGFIVLRALASAL